MIGFKIIKTSLDGINRIVGVNFDGINNYQLFVEAVKTAYALPPSAILGVENKQFVIPPDLFEVFVTQYIGSTDFILDIKLEGINSPHSEECIPETAAEEVVFDIPSISGAFANIENSQQISIPDSPLEEISPPYQTITSTHGRGIPIIAQGNNFYIPADCFEELPSTQDIKQLFEVKEAVKHSELENRHRINIAKGIISLILKNNPNRKLIREDFLQLAQSITEIFPSEVKETYYVPFKHGHLAKGKLYDAYNNKRSRLSAAGVIRRRVKTKSKENRALRNGISDANTIIVDDSDFATLKLQNVADWNVVIEQWTKTHSFRQNELKDENFKTADYFEKYKVLSNEKNYELFDIDFHILYPLSKNIYELKLYYIEIIKKAGKLKDPKSYEILTFIDNTHDSDSKLALSLMLIPYLLPNCRQRNKAEIQESFIFYCKNILHADNEIRARVSRLKIESQPKIFLVGDSERTICVAYVDICGKRLKFLNPLKAIEVCFHCFMGMNIKYPKYCSHVWLLVQKLIFKINTPWDTEIPSVTTLINDLCSNVQT